MTVRHSSGRVICVVAAVGLAGAVVLILATLVLDRPVPHAASLLIVAVPAVAVGQVWGIMTLRPRRRLRPTGLNAREFFFRGLPKRTANALLGVAFLCWLAAMLSFLSLTSGGPAGPAGGCRYRLDDKGSVKCVSRRTYLHVGAAEQRLAAAVLGAFFALHAGMAAADLARRRARPQ